MCDQRKWSMQEFTPLSMWKSARGHVLLAVELELSDSLTLQELWLGGAKLQKHSQALITNSRKLGLKWDKRTLQAGVGN